ncbi:MAG: SMC family ATPase [Candidatus Aenigmatarchaeota archaeon]
MITRVKMVNWKSHLDSELKFSKGVNALIGIMGSGKTSVMQAIAFALFGTFSALGSKKLALDDLIMSKPQKKRHAMVEVEFEAGDGKKYTVRRTIEREKGTVAAEIREDGKLLEVSPQGVTREVERILQMDYDLFQRAIYSEQNALDYFLQIPKGKRMQQIDEMLKLDRYERARESAVSIKNNIMARRKEMVRVVEDLKTRKLDEKLVAFENEIKKLEGEKRDLDKTLGSLEKERKKLSENVVQYEASHDMLNDAVRKSESLASRLDEMKRQADIKRKKLGAAKADPESLKSMASDITKLETALASGEREIRVLRETLSLMNGKMLFLRDQMKDTQAKLDGMKGKDRRLKILGKALGNEPEKKLAAMLENVEALKKTLYVLMAEKTEMEKSLSDLRRAGDKCPVCDSHIEEEKKKDLTNHRLKHIVDIDLRIRETKAKVAKESDASDGFRKSVLEYAEIKRDLKDFEFMSGRMREATSKRKLLDSEIKTVVSQIRVQERKEAASRRSLEKLRVARERSEDVLKERDSLETLLKEMEQAATHLGEAAKQRKALEKKITGHDIKVMRSELQETIARSRGIEAKLTGISQRMAEKKTDAKEIEEQASTLAKYKQDIENYASISESMDVFVNVLRSTQDQLRDEFLKTVNFIMSQIWGELYPYDDFSEVRLLVDKDYVLQLKSRKEWMNADIVSGGERSLACLALRIAFALAFTPNLRWLILDEPTHNLDRSAIEHFGSVLKDRMENIIDQVFLITHEERLSDYITGSTYHLTRDKESDGVTKMAEA